MYIFQHMYHYQVRFWRCNSSGRLVLLRKQAAKMYDTFFFFFKRRVEGGGTVSVRKKITFLFVKFLKSEVAIKLNAHIKCEIKIAYEI